MRIIAMNDGLGALTQAAKKAGLHFTVPIFSEQKDEIALSYAVLNEVPLANNVKDVGGAIFDAMRDITSQGRLGGIIHQSHIDDMYSVISVAQVAQPTFLVWAASHAIISKENETLFYDYLTSLAVYDYITYYRVITGVEAGVPDGSAIVYFVSIKRDAQKSTFSFPDKAIAYEPLYCFLEDNPEKKYDVDMNTLELVKEEAQTGTVGSMVLRKSYQVDDNFEIAFEGDAIRWGSFYQNKRRVYPAMAPHLYNMREFGTYWNGRKRYFTPLEVLRIKGFQPNQLQDITRFGLKDELIYKMGYNSANVFVAIDIFKQLKKSLEGVKQEGEINFE